MKSEARNSASETRDPEQRWTRFRISNLGFRESPRKGQAVLISVVFLLFASVAFLASVSAIGLRETAASRRDARAKQSYFLAEAGLEDVAWRMKNRRQYAATQSVILDGAAATVTVVPSGTQRVITSHGNITSAIRRAQVVVIAGVGAAFNYGMHAGNGGVFMENNSRVIGSIYSGGNITGQNSPEITGDAFASGGSTISGILQIGATAWAHAISNSTVARSATSTASVSSSTVGENAYADTVDGSTVNQYLYYCASQSGNTIGVPPAIQSCPAPGDLPAVSFPISDAQISDWEAAAEAGGIYAGPCPYLLNTGTTPLGPLKIPCDFTMRNDAIVTVNGPLWVAGDLLMQNTARFRLAATYGSQSEVIIADNPSNRTTSSKVVVQNSAEAQGSGTPGSYLMLISQNNSAELGGSEVAISPRNFSNLPVYYAPHGQILIENNTSLKEAAAYLIHIRNFAEVIYESGLANTIFTAGATGGWDIQSWQEVR